MTSMTAINLHCSTLFIRWVSLVYFQIGLPLSPSLGTVSIANHLDLKLPRVPKSSKDLSWYNMSMLVSVRTNSSRMKFMLCSVVKQHTSPLSLRLPYNVLICKCLLWCYTKHATPNLYWCGFGKYLFDTRSWHTYLFLSYANFSPL